jgi:methionine synthase II (cobalamin-independent)
VAELLWPTGVATGIGSLPGTDIAEAIKVVFGELPDLPYLPELPARGPGADMIGRTAGLLVDLPVELYAARWQLAARPGRDARRTADFWQRDLDVLTEQAAGYTGILKVQSTGPWTLSANLDLRTGGPVLRDTGAVRDLTTSLAEGLRAHLGELTARVPGATLLLQLDEPSLPAVVGGHLPTESGLGLLPPVAPATAADGLRSVIDRVALPVVVHCCAPHPPVGLLRESGVTGVALDLDTVSDDAVSDDAALDELGEALDAGLGLLAGAVPARVVRLPAGAEVADRIRRLWRRLGLAAEALPRQVVVTQGCGLAGVDPDRARMALAAAREAGRRLADS